MAERSTIARPYAEAVFGMARDAGDFDRWSGMLALMCDIADVEAMQTVIADPKSDREVILGIFFELGGDRLDHHAHNLLRILMEGRRMSLLPLIAEQFEALRAEEEKRGTARVLTAHPLTEAQEGKLRSAIEAKLGRSVDLEWDVDEALIGGTVVRIGDTVIDGSALGRLTQLAQDLG